MRQIVKGAEPASLTAHRKTPHCDYDNYGQKEFLRHSLVTEQRGLCCYCMNRIHSGPATMKIEHWQSQSRHVHQQLSYWNLLGACLGGNDQPPRLQHCDTRKGDSDLQWNPADPVHHIETRLRYELDGSIHSDDAEFDLQLAEVLNLNLPVLRNHRKGVYDAVLEWVRNERRRLRGPIPRNRLERERDRHASGADELSPFSQVAVWLLNEKLGGMAA